MNRNNDLNERLLSQEENVEEQQVDERLDFFEENLKCGLMVLAVQLLGLGFAYASKIKYTKIEAVLTLLKEREGEELGSILCTIDVEAGDNIETLTTSYQDLKNLLLPLQCFTIIFSLIAQFNHMVASKMIFEI